MKKSTLATMLLTIGVFFWGFSFVAVKEAVDHTDVFSFIFMRFLLAGLIMAAISIKRLRRCGAVVVKKGIVAGLVLAASFISQTLGVKYTTATNAAFITGLCVVLVPIIVTVLDRKSPGFIKVASVVVAFVGLGLLTLKNGFSLRVGDIWLLACALGFAVHLVMMNRYVKDIDTLPFTAIQLLTIAAVAGAVGIFINGSIRFGGGPVVIRAVVFCAVFASAYIYTVQATYQRFISEIKTAIIFALEPLFAAFAAYFALGEILSHKAMLGGAMILIGAVMVDVELKKKAEKL